MIPINICILQGVSDELMNQHIICFTGPQVSKFLTTMLLQSSFPLTQKSSLIIYFQPTKSQWWQRLIFSPFSRLESKPIEQSSGSVFLFYLLLFKLSPETLSHLLNLLQFSLNSSLMSWSTVLGPICVTAHGCGRHLFSQTCLIYSLNCPILLQWL